MKTRAIALALTLAVLAGCGGDASTTEITAAENARTGPSNAKLAQATRAVVWAVGDAATPGTGADRVAALVRRGRPDRFLYLGDVYETGTADDFQRLYQPRFGTLARITDPTIGNHEWGNRFSGYYKYWAVQKGRRQPPWSKIRVAGWDILSLNSEAAHGPGSPQIRWLDKALRGPGNCRIAFWHRPRYSAGLHGSAADMAPVWDTLTGHARIVLSGHDHDLQRWRPRGGLIQYVAGAGGRSRYALHGAANLAWGRADVNGALRIVLKPNRALLEFRAPGGRLLDRSRVSCTGVM
jgi:hypothetical protein